jgi:chitin disaccharide deacetylase
MKRLIVNADDLGADESRNAGIFDAIEAGSVTSVSILPNGQALADALRRIRTLNSQSVSFGIHLNLSEGTPVEAGLRRIPGPDGRFRGKSSTQKLLSQCGDSELEREIRRELSAQIKRIQDSGVFVDHVDGHQHVHVLPAAARAAAEAANMHGIPWVRIPEEPVAPSVTEEETFFSRNAAAARPLYKATGMHTTDSFRGLYLKGALPSECWVDFLESLRPGITELMVHPGRFSGSAAGPFAGFSTPDRVKELTALTDGRFLGALQKTGVQLIRFPDIEK